MKLFKFNLIVSLLLPLIVLLIAASPAQADQMTVGGLQITFTAALSQPQVISAQTFSLTVNASAHCVSDLPLILMPVSKILITGRIVAKNSVTGVQLPAPLTANDYETTITAFPKKVGDPDFSTTQVVQLQFPSGIESGTYSIVGQLVRVQAFVGPLPIDRTSMVPANLREQTIGSVNYFVTLNTPVRRLPVSPTPVLPTATETAKPSPEPSPTLAETPIFTEAPTLTPFATPGPTPVPTSSIVNLSQPISSSGTVIAKMQTLSTDKKASVIIQPGITGRDASGAPLKQISVSPIVRAPDPPPAVSPIGSSYDFEPTGTTFDSPVTLIFTYDAASLNGLDQYSLYLAWWNAASGNWTSLPSQVDVVNHLVSAEVAHFTVFSILAPQTITANPPVPVAVVTTPTYPTPPQTQSNYVTPISATPAVPAPRPDSSYKFTGAAMIDLIGLTGVSAILIAWRMAALPKTQYGPKGLKRGKQVPTGIQASAPGKQTAIDKPIHRPVR